jgi:hypothetical protein
VNISRIMGEFAAVSQRANRLCEALARANVATAEPHTPNEPGYPQMLRAVRLWVVDLETAASDHDVAVAAGPAAEPASGRAGMRLPDELRDTVEQMRTAYERRERHRDEMARQAAVGVLLDQAAEIDREAARQSAALRTQAARVEAGDMPIPAAKPAAATSLAERCRQVLRDGGGLGLSSQEVAQTMGLDPVNSSVRQTLSRLARTEDEFVRDESTGTYRWAPEAAHVAAGNVVDIGSRT